MPSVNQRRVRAVVRREFNEIIRDPLYLGLAVLVPPVLMMIFGFGLKLDVENLPLGVCDMDQSQLSRLYVDSFIQSESFELKGLYTDKELLAEDLRNTRLRCAIIIPENFEEKVRRNQNIDVALLIDGTIPIRADVARGYAVSAHSLFLSRLVSRIPQLAYRVTQTNYVQVKPRILFNPELKSNNFIVPGILATVLMYYPALITTLSIVREKENQSILALYSSPITRFELLLGKIIPYWVISIVNFITVFLLAIFLFRIPFEGSLILLLTASLIYVFTNCALGLMISCLVETQVSGILVTMVLTVLPSFLYSGFFTPLSASSWSIWIMGRFVPATYYLDVIRGVFLKGTGWSIHLPAMIVLLIFGMILYLVAFSVFRKQMR
jgi:ABC-2 type transport system permease protein